MPSDHAGRSGGEVVNTSPVVSDEVKYTTCYMCACRCGIKVHLRNGELRYIEGNRNHPVNKGVLCAKGSAGIMQQLSPAKLSMPLRRVGPRGSGEFEEISWEEALGTATQWLSEIRYHDPRKLAFFTGRDQSQALTGYWASQFGTPNYAAHGGFCSVNMAAAGLYSIGGSFWEFGEPDWERTKYLLMFGVAEDHDSNPIKIGLGKLKGRDGTKFVSVNPVQTGYSAIADEWIGIRPGSDGLFVMALIHELLRARKIDLDYLVRYTNAPWLVRRDPGSAEDGLFVRDRFGNPLAFDKETGRLVSALLPGITPALSGEFDLHLDVLGGGATAVPAFQLMAERYSDARYAPEAVAERTGISGSTIRRIAAELARVAFEEEITLDVAWTDWAGRRQEKMIGRPVAMHAMRGISAHSNGFHTCRSLHVLQMLLGSIDCPGGFRYKPPFPKPAPPGPKPAAKPGQVVAGKPMPGPPLGFPQGPEDLLVDPETGAPQRIDKAFSWDFPLAAHGMMHMVIRNAWAGDPYPIDTLFMFMANMSWNSSMNTAETMRMLTDQKEDGGYRIPRIIYSDAYYSEMVPYADLILPDTTYLERWDCISLLDRPICSAEGAADSIRQPVLKPDREVRPFQDVLIDLGARLGLPGFTADDATARYPGGYADYIANHERAPGIGSLAGWRGADGQSHGRGAANPKQLDAYIENQCFWQQEFPLEHQFFKHANQGYLQHAQEMGWIPEARAIVLQLYCEPLQRFRLAALGHGEVQPQQTQRKRVATYFDPLPFWYPPFEETLVDEEAFPLHALTQRPMAMYHSWGSQNAWLRQIHGWNKLYMNRETAARLGIAEDDWVWIESHNGRVKGQVKCMEGCNENTVWTWNAIGKRRGAWNLSADANESTKGFLLNHAIGDLLPAKGGPISNSDPVTGQAAWFDLRVRVTKADDAQTGMSEPQFSVLKGIPGLRKRPKRLRFSGGLER